MEVLNNLKADIYELQWRKCCSVDCVKKVDWCFEQPSGRYFRECRDDKIARFLVNRKISPSMCDTLLYWSFLIKDMKFKGLPLNNPAREVAKKVKCIWDRASIPSTSEKRVSVMIGKLQKKREMLIKSFSRDKNRLSYQLKLATFREKANLLCDIACCKCEIPVQCNCSKDFKVTLF